MTFRDRLAFERTYGTAERYRLAKEKIAMFIAWHLLPKLVRKWVVIRAHADATMGKFGGVHPDEVTAFQLTERMN